MKTICNNFKESRFSQLIPIDIFERINSSNTDWYNITIKRKKEKEYNTVQKRRKAKIGKKIGETKVLTNQLTFR